MEEQRGRVSRQSMARMKELQLIELRRAWTPWDKCAEIVGYKSGESARQIWRRAIKRHTTQNIDEIQVMILETYVGLLQTFMPKARRGDEKAADVVIKATKELTKHFPDMPFRSENENKQVTPEELAEFLLLAKEQWDRKQAAKSIDVTTKAIEVTGR